jgi:hypothetical protein
MTEKKVVKKVVAEAEAESKSKKSASPVEKWLKAHLEVRHGGLSGEDLAKAKKALVELEAELLKQL